jgi:bis(5'-nucleosyl)-tetraphosphatase (symmetrical)
MMPLMATYVIGDVQGCFITLERLLGRIAFDSGSDRLWLAGDLVNRGPDSLDVLRWAKSMGDGLVAVLGNHDLHLLARAAGERAPSRRDTFDDVLEAPDCDELLSWLRLRPLVHREGTVMLIHAGLSPRWRFAEVESLARLAEEGLRRGELDASSKAVVDTLTRMRTCRADGDMCSDYSGPPGSAPHGCRPWYELADIPEGVTVYFGHWAALDVYRGDRVVGLDSGCVWGRSLTAVRIEDGALFQEPSELKNQNA